MAELVQAQLLARRRGDAIRSMEGWLKDHPGDTDFLLALGNEYLTAGVNENAKFVFNRLLALTPRNQVVLNNLAWLIRDDDLTRAIELANAAIEVAPNWFAAQDTLGVLLTKKGDFKRALRHLERANQARPGDPSISYHLAEVLARDGKPARAREVLNDILTSTVDFPERSEARALQDHLK